LVIDTAAARMRRCFFLHAWMTFNASRLEGEN
jgi:hypothetical protein